MNISMQPLQTIALIIGLVAISTRLPGIFEPRKYMHWLERTFVKKKRFRWIGILSAMIFLLFFYYLLQAVTILEALVSMFVMFGLVFGLLAIFIPELPTAMFAVIIKKSDTTIRVMCTIVVLIGVLLVYLALQ